MKILAPGQKVVLNEGEPGEPSTRLEAEIVGVHIFRDLTVQYTVRWWCEKQMNEVSVTRLDFKPVNQQLITLEV